MTGKIYSMFLLLAFLLVSGCCQNPYTDIDKNTVVSINNYNITRDEFEKDFKTSVYGKTDTPESRRDFLNSLIGRKLILQYAQKEGFDKEKSFLRMIERFWEQSLLKIALDKKTREIAAASSVTDDEVRMTYDTMLKESKVAGSYDSAYKRIKWELIRAKETKLMNDWIAEMRGKARIGVNDDILNEKK